MFLDNKYTKIYYKIITNAQLENRVKKSHDGNQIHHIIPRCMGGSNDPNNLVLLTYKEHRVCHRLLINMTGGNTQWKMKHAYKLFNNKYDLSGSPLYEPMNSFKALKGAKTRKSKGSYKFGKDNNFAQPEIIELVRNRMLVNNPMKTESTREKVRQNNHRNKAIVTPAGRFVSRAAALRHHQFKHWKVLYDLMVKYPDQYYWD